MLPLPSPMKGMVRLLLEQRQRRAKLEARLYKKNTQYTKLTAEDKSKKDKGSSIKS